jgi:hypothetical protein
MLVVSGHCDLPLPEEPEAIFGKPFNTAELMQAVERLYLGRHG